MGNCVQGDANDDSGYNLDVKDTNAAADAPPRVTPEQTESYTSWGCTRWEFAKAWHDRDKETMKKWMKSVDGVCEQAIHTLVENAMTTEPSHQRETLFLTEDDPPTSQVLEHMLEDLIDAGVDPDHRDDEGCTPLMVLLGTSITSKMASHAIPVRLGLCKLLLRRGADPGAKDHDQRTALHHLASTRGSLPAGDGYTYDNVEGTIIKELEGRKKSEFNGKDCHGMTPLMVAIAVDNKTESDLQMGRVRELVRVLMKTDDAQALDKRDSGQRSALIYAALGLKVSDGRVTGRKETHQHYGIVRLLLDHGASLSLRAVVDGLEFPWMREVDDVEMVRHMRLNEEELHSEWGKFDRHQHHKDQVQPFDGPSQK